MKNIIVSLLFVVPMMGQTLSFPWAVGHGKYTTGGRGYGLFFVTNTNNSGTGSLRQALEDADSAGGGNIIPRVGGTITLSSDLAITGDNITFWGMAAPGDGLAVYNDETYVEGENIIITDIRFMGGDTTYGTGEDSFRIQNQSGSGTFSNYMLDHLSIRWGGDENFSIETGTGGSKYVSNVTIQNSILSEGFASKNAILWGKNITNVSFIGNYFANTNERNVRASSTPNVSWEQINNWVYHYGVAVNPTNKHSVDVIGNVFEDGPATQLVSTIHFDTCSSGNCPPSGDTSFTGTQLYHTDNTFNGGAISVSSNVSSYITGSANVSSGYSAYASSGVKDSIIANAGARRWTSGLDALDAHMIADGINGSTGSYQSNEAGTTGLPTLSSGTPYTDTDSDGMGDDWEMDRWGDLDETHNGDDDADGYTNLEEFMHYLVGRGDSGSGPEPPTPTLKKAKIKGRAYLNGSPVQIYIGQD